MAAAVQKEALTLYVHYEPRKAEGEPFKLKLKVPLTKTVGAMTAAFAKAVARSERGYGLTLDASDCFVNRMDAQSTYVRPEALVSEFDDREEIRVVRRDDVPEPEVDTTNWAAPRPTAFWISHMKDDGGI